MDENASNLEECMQSNAQLINENMGYQAEIKRLREQLA